MKSYEEMLDQLKEVGEYAEKDCLLLDGFEGGLVGYILNGDEFHAVYDKEKMLQYYIITNECTYEDAVEWFEYNTLRSLPYCAADVRPVIMETFK